MKYSIIIVTYNNSKYIKKCINSIINQTFKNFNLIIVDDGSTDDTKEIIKEYLNNKNVEYYYKKNTGVADSRNYAITKVKTEYFLFVDSDDYIAPDLLETANKYDNYEILSFKAILKDINYREKAKLNKGIFDLIDGEKYLFNLMHNNYFFLVPWGYIYNTKFFKKHKFKYEKNYVHEDDGLTPIIILKSKKIISIDYYGYYYYLSKESITRTSNLKKIELHLKSAFFHYDSLMKYINSSNYNKKFIKEFKNFFSIHIFKIWIGILYNKKLGKKYVKELKKRKVWKNFKINIISIIRIIFLNINSDLYLKFCIFVYYYIYKFKYKISKYLIK